MKTQIGMMLKMKGPISQIKLQRKGSQKEWTMLEQKAGGRRQIRGIELLNI